MTTKRAAHLTAPFRLPAEAVADVRLCANGVHVTVRGDIDVHTAPVLRRRLTEVVAQGEERVVVHLDAVTFMDSSGLGTLVAAHRAQTAGGGRFELVCEVPRLLRLIEITGLDRVFTVNGQVPPQPR